MEQIVIYLLMVHGTEIYKFKAKDSEVIANTTYLGNISEGFSGANTKKSSTIWKCF